MNQEKIALITDSTCDLSLDELSELNIHLLPLKVVYQDRQYQDRVEIQPEEVYATIDEEAPGTSTPSPGEALALFEKLRDEGFSHAISMHISGGLSGTADAVRTVSKQFQSMKIEVIDSKGLSMALGFQVMEASRALREGLRFEEIVKRVHDVRSRMNVFFVVKTLDYLRRGGRIGYVQATLGGILDMKPIIGINEEGKYFTVAKVRGRKKSIAKVAELVAEYGRNKAINLAVVHGGAEEEGRGL
ncbi:MAG: DegV family protein, partial [Eubacteriales bacterium]|nr:DegV family protein [Eubacteriales bacterium]